LKTKKSSIVKEKTNDRRLRGLGGRNSESLQRENKDIREVVKSDFKSRSLDLEGHLAKDQQITDSQVRKVELGGERTRDI
jgi:hypothetical protein